MTSWFVGFSCAVLMTIAATAPAVAQVCGDGAIDSTESCDDGNTTPGDGCDATCMVEAGFLCVPSLHASGVNPGGTALAAGNTDPHWVWSLSVTGANPTPGHVARNGAWANLPPGNWITTDPAFGASLNSQSDTFWFQNVFMPSSFAGNLTFPVAVAADNAAEVFVNGTSYGSMVGFGTAVSIAVPSNAFVPGNNVVMIRLTEYIPGTPRGILMYPGGGGILSQCTPSCVDDIDCDDANPCTTDTCIAGACHADLLPLGATCTSTGICTDANPIPICVDCIDTSTTVTATVPDLGCDQGARFCDESGAAPLCVGCLTDDHCPLGSQCIGRTCIAPTPDGGVVDAGEAPDSGPPDTGSSDGGGDRDGGGIDSGTHDGGALDTGVVVGRDGGTPSPRDAGPARDGGPAIDDTTDEGCQCSGTHDTDAPSRFGGWFLLLLLVSVRRRPGR